MASVDPNDPNDPMAALIKRAMLSSKNNMVDPSGDQPGGVDPNAPSVPGDMPLPAPGSDPTIKPEIEPTKVEDPAGAPVVPPVNPAYDFSRLRGYDEGKFKNKKDAKYEIGRTLSLFDPTKGITPEVLAALNKLGYGTFSGAKDKLSLSGLTDVGRQNGLRGDYSGADFIQGFNGGDGKWSYDDPFADAQDGNGGSGGGGTGNGMLALNNPLNQSTQAGVPSDEAFFQQLMDAAQKSMGGNVTRQSLLDLLGLK